MVPFKVGLTLNYITTCQHLRHSAFSAEPIQMDPASSAG